MFPFGCRLLAPALQAAPAGSPVPRRDHRLLRLPARRRQRAASRRSPGRTWPAAASTGQSTSMPWPPQPDGPGTPWPGRCRNDDPEQEGRCPDTSAARSAGAAPPGAAHFPTLPSGSPPRSASAFPTGSGSDQRPIPASAGSTTSGDCRRSSRHRESTPGLPAAADAGPPSPRSARHPASPRSGPGTASTATDAFP